MIHASLYHSIYLYTVIILTALVAARLGRQSYIGIRNNHGAFIPALALTLALAIFIGMRPISGRYFGDTSNYAHAYYIFQAGFEPNFDSGEWFWTKFMYGCAQVMDVSDFFTIVDLLYFGLTLWACKRLMPRNVLTAFLFNLAAFSFFTYATNGIRNGLACSSVLLILSYIDGNLKDKIIAGVLAFFTMAIHKTTMLPLGMAVISYFIIKKFQTAYSFWILSILISLVAGGAVTAFFSTLGFDNRLSYLQKEMDEGTFSHSGFRFDFLIYSMMPIVLGYYVVIKRGIQDRVYMFLLNTYTLSNAFWVMVIRASYSNRFAYLSWFMYPIVLAYPLLKLDIWGEKQGKYTARIMLAHVAFTWFMSTIY